MFCIRCIVFLIIYCVNLFTVSDIYSLYCIAVYVFRYSYGVGLVLGFGVAALECI